MSQSSSYHSGLLIRSLPFLVVSIGLHLMIFLLVVHPATYGVQHGPSSVEVNLVAAPPRPTETPPTDPVTPPVAEVPPVPDSVPKEIPPLVEPPVDKVETDEDAVKSEPTPQESIVTPTPPPPVPSPAMPRVQDQGDARAPTSGKDSTTSTSSGATKAAAYLSNPPPPYPEDLQRRGIQGTTVIVVTVLPDGTCANPMIQTSSGHTELDAAALKAVKRWRFHPETVAGLPVSSRVTIPFTFTLH